MREPWRIDAPAFRHHPQVVPGARIDRASDARAVASGDDRPYEIPPLRSAA
jgi:hypothetical protein